MKRSEYGACKRAIGVGQSHEHEFSTGPNVQGIGFHFELALLIWSHLDFLVTVGEVALGKVEAIGPHESVADGTESPIRSEYSVE